MPITNEKDNGSKDRDANTIKQTAAQGSDGHKRSGYRQKLCGVDMGVSTSTFAGDCEYNRLSLGEFIYAEGKETILVGRRLAHINGYGLLLTADLYSDRDSVASVGVGLVGNTDIKPAFLWGLKRKGGGTIGIASIQVPITEIRLKALTPAPFTLKFGLLVVQYDSGKLGN